MTRGDTRRPTQPRHSHRATYPTPNGAQYVSECACGWSSALVASHDNADAEWRKHRNDANEREAASGDPAEAAV